MKYQLKLLLTALMFYTRIPVPRGIDHSEELLNKATRYFPLIGIMVGALMALVYWLSGFILPSTISVILMMLTGIVVTGAFHEDGFADVCDGFGGGYSIEQKLNIMKDSRVGTYGLLGLIFLILMKFLLLIEIDLNLIALIIAVQSLSRLSPVLIIFTSDYVRQDALSKVKPIGKKIKTWELLLAVVFAIAPLFLLGVWGFVLILPLLISQLLSLWFFKRHLGGYTGDCLGAAQQFAEVVLYFSYLLLCNYIL